VKTLLHSFGQNPTFKERRVLGEKRSFARPMLFRNLSYPNEAALNQMPDKLLAQVAAVSTSRQSGKKWSLAKARCPLPGVITDSETL
jgi:hypothetical protein